MAFGIKWVSLCSCAFLITSSRITIPPEHGVESVLELGTVRLVNTARVDPEAFQPIMLGLISTKPDLSVVVPEVEYLLHKQLTGQVKGNGKD